jgi:hypothetical protein
MVMEFYDLMVMIWGGAPSTEPLSFGTHSASKADKSGEPRADTPPNSGADISTNPGSPNEEYEYDSDDSITISLGNNVSSTSGCGTRKEATTQKRPASNPVPHLIDNKRKHMEWQLSAAQRDKLLMQESKEEKEFRKDLSNSLKESNNIFAESMKAMSTSMMAFASSLQKSFEHGVGAGTAAGPQYINHMAPAYIPGHMQHTSNVIQQGNYIYSPSGQLVDIATVRNDSDVGERKGERKGEQTFYQQ